MSISRRNFLVSGALLAGGALATRSRADDIRSADSLPTNANFEQLGALIEEAVRTGGAPGIALTAWSNGKQVFVHAAGMANLETGTRVGAESVFRIGSLTKQFTGALVLKLVAAGKLELSDRADKHLSFLGKHEPFSILELLNHTAGVRDGDYDLSNLQGHSQVEQARRMAQQNPFFDFAPGTAWLYSNANYILVGAVIEQVTGKPLAEAAAQLLLEPLGLGHSAFDRPDEIVTGRVSGYTPTEDPHHPFQNAEYLDVALTGAAGAMRSTVSDLCRWHQALLSGLALPRPLREAMTAPGKLRNGQLAGAHRFSENDRPMGDTQYGLGLMLDNATRDRSLIVNHHGGINGFASYLATHVPSGLGFACLCNADTNPALPFRALRRKIFEAVL